MSDPCGAALSCQAIFCLSSVHGDLARYLVDREDVARHQMVCQFNDHVNAHDPLRDVKLEALRFGFERLQACVADIARLAVGTENHLFIAVIRCLRHVDS